MTPWHSLPFFHWHGAFPFSGASMWKLEGISLMPWEMYSGTRIHSANPIIQTADWNSFFFLFFFSPCVNDLSKESMKWDDGRKLFSLPEGCCLPPALSWTERKAGVLQPCSTSLFPEFWDITLPGKSQGIPLLPTSPLLGIKFLFKRN